ncbi:hypothetical protein BKH41_06755 [Helicobacter sp. 12S02232-10]|nr:hypothetical protein BKH41_06755 [Helicobacter sp. 12S02232-10]
MWHNGVFLGKIRIASKSQELGIYIIEKLPEKFEKLPKGFFSKIEKTKEKMCLMNKNKSLKFY